MKIGMFVGLVLAAGVMVYVCTRPGLSPRARILKQNNEFVLQSVQAPQQGTAELLSPGYDSNSAAVLTQQPEQISEPVRVEPQPVNDTPPRIVYVEKSYQTQKFYIVRKGDTLSKISKIYYGSPSRWYKIYEANRDVLDNPDMLRSGMKLRIPN